MLAWLQCGYMIRISQLKHMTSDLGNAVGTLNALHSFLSSSELARARAAACDSAMSSPDADADAKQAGQ